MSQAGGAPGTAAGDFEASAFHPDLPSGRAPGRLRLGSGGVRFSTGERMFDLSYDGLQLRLGGASDRLIFLTHPSQPDLTLYTADHDLLKHPEMLSRPALAAEVAAVGRKKSRGRLITAGVLATLVALVAGLVLLKDPMVAVVADQVPPELEVRLGNLIFSQIETETVLIESAELEDDLEQMATPLLEALPEVGYPFEFHIAEDASINAFAVPGGNIVVHSGLLLEAERPEELLGVLAHEIAHVTERHSLRNILGTVGVWVVVQSLLGDASGIIAVAAEGGTHLMTLGFSRDLEREADDAGWEYLLEAGIDPRGMITFFETLQQETTETLGEAAVIEEKLTFLSTHPSSAERIERLRQKWQDAGYDTAPVLDPVDFESFQDKIRRHLSIEQPSQDPESLEDPVSEPVFMSP